MFNPWDLLCRRADGGWVELWPRRWLGCGLVTFIPYVGALVGGALALGLGLFQFWGIGHPLRLWQVSFSQVR